MESEFLSPTQAAEILNVSRQTITQWCRDNKLRAVLVGKRWVVYRDSVEELADGRSGPKGKRK